jgi:hypothetical protein
VSEGKPIEEVKQIDLLPLLTGGFTTGQAQFGAFTVKFVTQPANEVAVKVTLVPLGMFVIDFPEIFPVVEVIVSTSLIKVTEYVFKSVAQTALTKDKLGKGLIVKVTIVRVLLTQFVVRFLVSAKKLPADVGVNVRLPVAILLPPVAASYQSTVSLLPTVTERTGIIEPLQIDLSPSFIGAFKIGQAQFGAFTFTMVSQFAFEVEVKVPLLSAGMLIT